MNLQKNITRHLIYVLFVSIPLVFFSCYPGGIEYYNETDIVATQYDLDFDFASNKTYYMSDSVYHAVGEGEEDDVDHSYDSEILNQIETHLSAAGYTRFESDEIPDSVLVDSANVIISVVITSNEYSGVGYIPGGGYWWGWGWGWYGGYSTSYYYPHYPWFPGYGWGYPYYYSYSTGSLFIEMAHEDGIDPVEKIIPISWQAVINGLLSDSNANTRERVDRGIDQVFEQSPYLSN